MHFKNPAFVLSSCHNYCFWYLFFFVQFLSCVQLSATPWTAGHQASLFFTISQCLFKLMSIESLMPSNHLILLCPHLLLPSICLSIRVFSSESDLALGGRSIGASASAPVLPVNIQGWFPLGLTGLILLSKGLSRDSSLAPQYESINSSALSLLYGPTLRSIHPYSCFLTCLLALCVGDFLPLLNVCFYQWAFSFCHFHFSSCGLFY